MIMSKSTLVLLSGIILISVMLANLAQQIDTEQSSANDMHPFRGYNETAVIDDSNTELMWFMQVSDLHISMHHGKSRYVELRQFCCETVDVIKPSVVVSSGDLTDAKVQNNMGSTQFESEWKIYKDVLDSCHIRNKTMWLDIRGNHDTFDVPEWPSYKNYFTKYSIQGPRSYRSYMRVIEKDGEKYGFIGVDACLNPGPKRPFNFFGILTKNDTDAIKAYLKAARDMNVQHLIWFGHYPTSMTISLEGDSIRNIIGDEITSKVYMCGHLHTVGGIVEQMYTMQKSDFLELELGDWKDNRKFRIAAIDHGLFSFVDVVHGKWPIVLITNPKHALFTMSSREPLLHMMQSTHIRLLAFSLAPIDSVRIKIDNNPWFNCTNKDGPLFVAKWNPNEYATGIHTMYARVIDTMGREITVSQPFSLDGSKSEFKTLAKFILMIDARKMFQWMFGVYVSVSILFLVLMRLFHELVKANKIAPVALKNTFAHNMIKRFWLLTSINRLFFPLLLFELYLIFGPWLIGEILNGHIGVVFSWGIFINGAFIPGSLTYGYGFLQLFLCQSPIILILAFNTYRRYLYHRHGLNRHTRLAVRLLKQLPFIFFISVQMLLAYLFFLAYGSMAFIFGPFRTWSAIMNCYLWYYSISFPSTVVRDTAKVFSKWQH